MTQAQRSPQRCLKKFKMLLCAVAGWWFAVTLPAGSTTSPEAHVAQVLGPYRTLTECAAQAEELISLLAVRNFAFRVVKCHERQEA